jgi:hypothetical protein
MLMLLNISSPSMQNWVASAKGAAVIAPSLAPSEELVFMK